MGTTISVIGVGGAGGRLAALAAPEVDGATHVVAVNTDTRELEALRVPVKLPIGAARTGGLGAGGAPGAGRLAAEDDLARLRELVEGRDLVVAIAGLGGGTGSGALPALLRAAREAQALTLAVVTVPFAFEGPRRRDVANEALRAVREAAGAVVVLGLDRLQEATDATALRDAFSRSDALLARCVATLCNLLAQPGYISLDFADLQQLVQHSGGLCSLGFAEASGPERAEAVARELLGGRMLEEGRLVGQAASMLTGIVGDGTLSVREVGGIMRAIEGAAAPGCSGYVGTYIDERLADTVRVIMLVSEFWTEPPDTATAAVKPRQGARPAASRPAAAAPGRGKGKPMQSQLVLQPVGRGRFKNVEPTLLDGEDLDIPTYVRRGIRLEV